VKQLSGKEFAKIVERAWMESAASSAAARPTGDPRLAGGCDAMPPQPKPQVLAYEPIPQWPTGSGVMARTAD
jgi:hypothetical protein